MNAFRECLLICGYVVEFLLPYVFSIAFQYFSIAPMSDVRFGDGIRDALKADTLSLLALGHNGHQARNVIRIM